MITILDYGLGNIGSLNNMLKRLNQNVIITSKPEHILNSKKLILQASLASMMLPEGEEAGKPKMKGFRIACVVENI